MGKEKRPYQDDTIVFPSYRSVYSATALGHGAGDPREEPEKYTQAMNEAMLFDATKEWIARLNENLVAAKKYISGELEAEIEAAKKIDAFMTEMGVDDMVEELESGDSSAADQVDVAMELASGETALEAMDEILAVDMFTSYGFSPPVVNLPIRLSPAVLVMLMGNSFDNFYNTVDQFSLENVPYLESWHYEDGVQTAAIHYWYENAEPVLERRHLRTGEKFRHLLVHRPVGEGEMMCIDITKDIRNEKTPEYANSAMFGVMYPIAITPDCQSAGRSVIDLVGGLVRAMVCDFFGWPFPIHLMWVPRPGILSMLQGLPIEMIIPRFINILITLPVWLTNYTLTHCETSREVFGREIIPATFSEGGGAYMMYGMDRVRFPSTYIQSRRVYGVEAAHMRPPTEYPVPEKVMMTLDEATKQIEDARKEHPEWLTDIKGFGQ
ncbi:MAG: hypothetical protein SVM80_09990 [Halobacteriota archaeon]|nr:hypothetical protein [Halobacteriota archaeon]